MEKAPQDTVQRSGTQTFMNLVFSSISVSKLTNEALVTAKEDACGVLSKCCWMDVRATGCSTREHQRFVRGLLPEYILPG